MFTTSCERPVQVANAVLNSWHCRKELPVEGLLAASCIRGICMTEATEDRGQDEFRFLSHTHALPLPRKTDGSSTTLHIADAAAGRCSHSQYFSQRASAILRCQPFRDTIWAGAEPIFCEGLIGEVPMGCTYSSKVAAPDSVAPSAEAGNSHNIQ